MPRNGRAMLGGGLAAEMPPAGVIRPFLVIYKHYVTPPHLVIPAKAGIHGGVDPGLRRDDGGRSIHDRHHFRFDWVRSDRMRAQLLTAIGHPLAAGDVAAPRPGAGQVLIRVHACAVCRTDLHVVDGELPDPKLPLIPGHEIVGTIVERGAEVDRFKIGDRVGVPWLGWTCGVCEYCRGGHENLCDRARFTGYQIDGGYAELTVADQRYCFALPQRYSDVEAAPLLCAGLIGYRTLRLAGEGERIGIYGFGAAAHILAQLARYQGRRVFAFTRPGDTKAQDFARGLGAVWAGGSDERPPEELDAALIFAPIGALVPAALAATRKGGTVVCGGIHMSLIPSFPYRLLWEERVIRSVANLTRRDAEEFLPLAPKAGIETTTRTYPLAEANQALSDLRTGALEGAAVLVP
jgi:propanol-preferring alcohol dehydrogenase